MNKTYPSRPRFRLEDKSMRILSLFASLAFVILLSGCAASQKVAQTASTEGSILVQTALVTNVRDVTIQGGQSTGIASFVGGVLGGVAGSNIGGGYGRMLAGVGGAVA